MFRERVLSGWITCFIMRLTCFIPVVLLALCPAWVQGQDFQISTEQGFLYRGVPNRIEVTVPGWSNDQVVVHADDSHLMEPIDDGAYWITPQGAVDELTLTVMALQPDSTYAFLGESSLFIRELPQPQMHWGMLREGQTRVSTWHFVAGHPLKLVMPRGMNHVDMTIEGFWLGARRDGVFQYFHSASHELTLPMMEALKNLTYGDQVWVGNIRYSGHRGPQELDSDWTMVVD